MINRSTILFLVVLLASLLPASVQAITGGEVQVATNGQDLEERNNAYRAGLRWLLNNRPQAFDTIDQEQLNQVLNGAQNFVDAFEFIELPNQQVLASVPVTKRVREAGAATHLLSIQYSIAAIAAALAVDDVETEAVPQRSLREITSALLWLLIRDGSTDLIVSDATTPAVASRVRELAGGFGWVIDFPELDVTDLAFIGPDEIDTAVNTEISAEVAEATPGSTLSPALIKASERYNKDLVLTAFAAKDAAGLWRLQIRRDFSKPDTSADQTFRTPLELTGRSLDRLLQQAMGWNAGLSGEGASATASIVSGVNGNSLSDGSAKIFISGVVGAADYLRLMREVDSLDGVEEATALEITQNSLLIGLTPRSALSGVSSTLQSQDWLRLADREQLRQQSRPATSQGAVGLSANTGTEAPDQSVRAAIPRADLFLQVVN